MMAEDNEFGNLYSVLTPISPFQSHHNPSRSEPAPPTIDNTASSSGITNACAISFDDGGMLDAPSNRDPNLNLHPSVQTHVNSFNRPSVSQDPLLIGSHGLGAISTNSLIVKADQTRVLETLDLILNSEVVATEHKGDMKSDQSVASKDAEFVHKDDKWQVQIEKADEDGLVIPGISVAQPNDGPLNPDGVSQVEAYSQGDDWESDSDYDLQIVLNENGPSVAHQYQGPVVMGEITGVEIDEDDDENEDGESMVIVSDNDAVHHPPPDDQADQEPDGEMKETGEIEKANGGASLPPKISNNNYGYHPYHSQFKYVRPGAVPLPGGSGQVRSTVNVGSIVGCGRGDWRQAGLKGPLQKGIQSGFWGSNASGSAFGVDFILPSQKIIFDVNIDGFEEKRWNHPDTDVSDFFNFGLNENSWKGYCKRLEQLRIESTMKSKAHVLVVGSQSDQEYDPDLPPELAAAAAAGIQHPSTENSNAQRADVGNTDIARGTGVLRAPLPTGRPIQVEVGSGERFPSSDTRPPRMCDLDTVIMIVLQGTVDDDSSAGYGAVDQPGNDGSREYLGDNAVEEDGGQTRNAYSDGYPESINRTKREVKPKEQIPEDQPSLPPEAPIEHSPGSRENSPVYLSDKFEVSPRRMKGEIHKRLRTTSPVESAVDGRLFNDKEVMSENLEGKDSPHVLSLEARVLSADESSQSEGNNHKDKEDINSIENTLDTTEHHHTKPVKLVSQGEHMEAKENSDIRYIKAGRSSDNRRAIGSRLDLQKGHKSIEKESIHDEHSPHPRDLMSNHHEAVNIHHRKDCNGNLETEKINMLGKRREGVDRRRERDYAIGILQLRGEDPHGRKYRADDLRKHEHSDGMIARHGGKVREGERSNKDEYLPSRKMLDNGNWRGYREKEPGFRIKEKGGILTSRYENMEDPPTKRRKDDEHARKDHFKKDEILRAHKDSISNRKRERDESLDHRKLDDHRSVRSKDEGLLHRERDDGYHSKQSDEEGVSRKEREDIGRTVHFFRKDGYKGNEREGSYKGTGRNGEQLKRKDNVKKSTVRSAHPSDTQKVHERRPKENSRKPRQPEGGQSSTSNSLKKPQEGNGGRNEMAGLIGTAEEGNGECREQAEGDERHCFKRGRSKLARSTSHGEMDYSVKSKLSSSAKVTDEPVKKSQVDVSEGKGRREPKDREPDKKHTQDRDLDSVRKLKKRSDRFKAPMPIQKDKSSTVKKTESEAPVNSDIKQECLPRKRRWISCK